MAGDRLPIEIPEPTLRLMYVDEGQSITQIAQTMGCAYATARARLQALGLLRTRADAIRLAATQGRLGPKPKGEPKPKVKREPRPRCRPDLDGIITGLLERSAKPAGESVDALMRQSGAPKRRAVDRAIDRLRSLGVIFSCGLAPHVRHFLATRDRAECERAYAAYRDAYRAEMAERKRQWKRDQRARRRAERKARPAIVPTRPKVERMDPITGRARVELRTAVAAPVRLAAARPTTAAWRDAPAIVPKGVTVQRCPSSTDSRFTFQPPAGWRGDFLTEWAQLRAREERA